MSAQDYGDLQDYIVNGDNFTKLQPDGSTLVIQGKYGKPPLIAIDVLDTYRPIQQDCTVGNCALIGHDIFTGQYVLLKIAAFDGATEDCLCALAGVFGGGECQAAVQSYVDSQSGMILFDVFPEWFLAELNLTSVEFSATVEYDFWFVACYGEMIVFPNLPKTQTGTCPPPGRIGLVNGVPVCMFDPPIPNPFPFALRSLRTSARLPARRNLTPSATQRALNPTVRPGIPRIMKPCGCGDTPDFEEALS
jgi:hypothetical protein